MRQNLTRTLWSRQRLLQSLLQKSIYGANTHGRTGQYDIPELPVADAELLAARVLVPVAAAVPVDVRKRDEMQEDWHSP